MEEKEKHAKEFAAHIVKDGIIDHAEDVVGNLGVIQSGEFGFTHLLESIDGETSVCQFKSIDKLYEEFAAK